MYIAGKLVNVNVQFLFSVLPILSMSMFSMPFGKYYVHDVESMIPALETYIFVQNLPATFLQKTNLHLGHPFLCKASILDSISSWYQIH